MGARLGPQPLENGQPAALASLFGASPPDQGRASAEKHMHQNQARQQGPPSQGETPASKTAAFLAQPTKGSCEGNEPSAPHGPRGEQRHALWWWHWGSTKAQGSQRQGGAPSGLGRAGGRRTRRAGTGDHTCPSGFKQSLPYKLVN